MAKTIKKKPGAKTQPRAKTQPKKATRKGQPMDEVEFDLAPGPAAEWAKVEAEFRRDWESGPDREGVTWEQASRAYRFGWQAAGGPTGAKGKPMDEVEFDGMLVMARRAWERRRASP
jgi:hypothetical protein